MIVQNTAARLMSGTRRRDRKCPPCLRAPMHESRVELSMSWVDPRVGLGGLQQIHYIYEDNITLPNVHFEHLLDKCFH